MMYKVKFTTAYKKSYKRIIKRGLDVSVLDKVIDELRQGNQLDSKHKDHMLKGEYAGFRECHLNRTGS